MIVCIWLCRLSFISSWVMWVFMVVLLIISFVVIFVFESLWEMSWNILSLCVVSLLRLGGGVGVIGVVVVNFWMSWWVIDGVSSVLFWVMMWILVVSCFGGMFLSRKLFVLVWSVL